MKKKTEAARVAEKQSEDVQKVQDNADQKQISLHKELAGHKGNPKGGKK